MVGLVAFFGEMWHRILFHAFHTFAAVSVSLLTALVLALCIAIPAALFPSGKRYIESVFLVVQAVPTFILTPLMVCFFGFSLFSIVVPTAILLALPLTLAFFRGLEETPEPLTKFYNLHRLPHWEMFIYVQLPHAFPSFLAGLRTASSSALLSVLAAEWIAGSGGLGVFLQELRRNFDIDGVVALTLVIILLSCLFFYGVIWLEKRLLAYFSS